MGLCFLALLLAAAPVEPDLSDAEESIRRLTEVLGVLQARAVDPFDPTEAVYQGALPNMVRTLDPHSAFLTPQQFDSLKEMQRSTEKGFGSVLSIYDGRAVVLQTLPGSPSAKAGMSPGDEIVVINGYPLANLRIEQLVALLTQTRQETAELMVQRPNFARLIPITLVPAELADPSVEHQFMLEPELAYIKLANFETDTAEELHDAIEAMGGKNLRGLVLDMRDNPGGVVETAVRIAAMFLSPGQRILWIEGRDGPQEEVRVPEGLEQYEFPLAVLIDEKTASAAELVAGALQDHDRAVLIGQRSYGKGLVQSVFDLSEGAGLALTTALYLSPSGRPIQRPLSDCRELQLSACEEEEPKTYPTDSGREIPGGGGLQPDEVVYPRPYTEFEAVMLQTSSFLDFASQFVSRGAQVDDNFEITPAVLDDFQLFLSERRIRPNLSEWSATLEFIRARLKQEIFNLTLGVKKGDEIEIREDPRVQAGIRAVKRGR